jgi:(p)ppGpp synthase/HD superfamily hydrolase
MKVVSNLPTGVHDDYIHAALLHDVVEDTDVTVEALHAVGYPDHVVEAVELLTHDKDGISYHDYVRQIRDSGNDLAIQVKIADNTTNLEGVDVVFPDAPWMRERYEKSLRILKGETA